MSTTTTIPEFRPKCTPPIIQTKPTHASHSRKSSIQSIRSPASPFDPVSSALATAQARYTISNSKSLNAHNEACHDFPGGNTRTVLHTSPFPLTFVKGEGPELTSADGDVYVDFLGEYTAGLYGHSNPLISAAITAAMSFGWNYGGPNNYERRLASKVTQRFRPSGMELVRFTNSGTEANTMAIAGAVAFTGRKKVMVFKNGYHGGTLSFPSTLQEVNTNLPHDFVIGPYNDVEGTKVIVSGLPKDSLAAIIVEPVQGSGGCIVGTTKFLQYLDETAHKLGAMFIVDEVMTSRLSYHGLSSSLNLKPDLITLGKWVGGGMTFGAFGGRKNGVMSMFDPRNGILSHSGTFNNNITTMAAGCAGLDIYTEDEVKRLNLLGADLMSRFQHMLAKFKIPDQSVAESSITEKKNVHSSLERMKSPPLFEPEEVGLEVLSISDSKPGMWISGKGSMLCIHFSGESDKNLQALFWHHLLENGIYIAQRGFIALNLEIRAEHVDQFLKAAESFVAKYRHVLVA